MTPPIQNTLSSPINRQANASSIESNPKIEGGSHQGSGINTPITNVTAKIARATMPAIAEEKRVHFNNDNSDAVTVQEKVFNKNDPPSLGAESRWGGVETASNSRLNVNAPARRNSIEHDSIPNAPARRNSIEHDSIPNKPARRGSMEHNEAPALQKRGDSPPRMPGRG